MTAVPLIIDTHTHFYDPFRAQGVPWPPKEEKRLYRTILPKDYKALPKPAPVTGTIVVEASAWVEDNQWILDLAASDPFILGLVGNLPARAPEFPELLNRFARNPVFRGLRIHGRQLQERKDDAAFAANLKQLADMDLSLDLLGGSDILPAAERLAEKLPGLRIVLDHVAGARIDGKTPEPAWMKAIRSAARRPNIFCKVSGLVEGSGKSDGTAPVEMEFYQPWLDAVWNFFGEDRVMYGSNWPVSELFAPCAAVQRIVMEYFGGKGRAAAEKYFAKNAKAVYQWQERSGAGR